MSASQTVSLHGRISDESGALVPGAKVTVAGPAGIVRSATAGSDGSYSFAGLSPGEYTVQASAPDLVLVQPIKISLTAAGRTLDLQLKVAATTQQVTVKETPGPSVSTDPSSNATALSLHGSDLDALADDPDDLAQDLQALAGPSAGPNGGTIFVDGFSGGELPPKDSIREVRVNQNPFSPEYDTLGYGRVEIFTKPGTDKLRGTGYYNFGDDVWNSRNPYAAQKAPFLLKEYGANLSGPLHKRASFYLGVDRHSIDNGAIINGTILDPATFTIINPFTQVFPIPQRRLIITPRVDYQLSQNNTLTVRYSFSRASVQDQSIGSFNLVSQGYNAHSTAHTLQATETAVLGANAINETRFQYFRFDSSNVANNPGPTIQVLSAFNGGGSTIGHSADTQDYYELQNYTSISRGKHAWKFGVRMRGVTDRNFAEQNFGGAFTFGGGLAPELDANNQPVLDPSGNPVLVNIASIERYRRTLLLQSLKLPPAQIRALGGGATQFSINAGNPLVEANRFDIGLFAGDDWRARPDLTISLGLRYENQTNIHDWRDFAPRIGVAWAPGGGSGKTRAKNVFRAGFGTFFDRFGLGNTITAQRYNGVRVQQFTIANPDFFPVVPVLDSTATRTPSSIWQISSDLRAPYIMQSAAGWERQLPFDTTLAVTFANSHGLHVLRSQDINAPLPGTQIFPYGGSAPIFLMESSGLYNQSQLITNVNTHVNADLSLFGSYVYNHARSNTDGLGTFPANPYSMEGEYGPASTDIRHRVSLGGTITTKWDLRWSPLLTAGSGPPFNITAGRDIYGDTLFNGRPGIATDPNKPGVVATPYGLLDPNPTPDEKLLPRNFGRGPGYIMLNLRIAKIFGFGPPREGATAGSGGGPPRGMASGPFSVFGGGGSSGASGRRYTLNVGLSIRNIFNHNNPGPIIGNIASPLFGMANQPYGAGQPGGTGFSESANNRRLELQARFTF